MIIGDSLLAELGWPLGARVICIRGTTLDAVSNLVTGGTVKDLTHDITPYRAIAFHVGTNNIGHSSTYIKNAFLQLLQVTRQ